MKHLVILSAIISFLIPARLLHANNLCGIMYPSSDTTSWGLGFIRMPNSRLVSIKGLTIKEKKLCYTGDGKVTFSNDDIVSISQNDFIYLGGEDYLLLKVFEIKDTRYKICPNTISGGIWVEFDELSSNGFMFTTYLSFISVQKNHYVHKPGFSPNHVNAGVNLLHSCLNLRAEPSLNGKIITCLRSNSQENDHRVTKIEILTSQNGWAEVRVYEYIFQEGVDESGDCNFKIDREYQGFIKVLDESGRPNIWYEVGAY